MARPSTYDQTKDYEQLANEYLVTCGREQTKLPKLSEFCREYIGANEDTVELWVKGQNLPEGAATSDLVGAVKRIKSAQREELIDDGLFGGKEVNVAMAIFLLKANHGMVETSRQELVGKDGQPLTINVKLDLAGGYIPPLGGVFTASTASPQRPSQVQSPSMAQESKKDDNSDNGITQASSL